MRMARLRSPLMKALILTGANLLVGLVLGGLVDLSLNFLMTHSSQIPSGNVLSTFRALYWNEREYALIQYSPDCSLHHDSLGYTLRPGSCTFSGPEFSNRFDVNRLGLRDDEKSLDAPEIIVLGDSEAMGWGVD